MSRPLYPRKTLGSHCTGGWVDNRAGVDGCGKSRPHQDSILGPSSPLRVAIPTELFRPTGHQQQWIIRHTTLTLHVSKWVPFTMSVLILKYRTVAMCFYANYQHLAHIPNSIRHLLLNVSLLSVVVPYYPSGRYIEPLHRKLWTSHSRHVVVKHSTKTIEISH
jgi:hypothetical protein